MDKKQVLKQMIDFNKAAFDSTFTAMVSFQEQMEKTAEGFMTKANWMPEEGKKAINGWLASCKKGRDTFKSTVDENFKKVEDFFAGSK